MYTLVKLVWLIGSTVLESMMYPNSRSYLDKKHK